MTVRNAAIYCRISHDREGRALGVAKQEEDCRALAERLGWEVGHVFVDNDLSASVHGKKPRPGFEDMIRRVEAGEFNAVLAWSTSRLTRRPMEHERLIPLFWERKIPISTVKAGDIDYTTARGRSRARDDARRDAEEAEETSERVERDVQRRAEAGEFHGGHLPFGIDADREIIRGKVKYVRFRHHTTDAPRVRDAARRLLAGETVYGIAKDFGMQPRTLKRAITNPAIAGLREYNGQFYPTPWEPIVDREDWERVCEILSDPSRRTSETNQRKYMLSGLVYCHCGNRMTSTSAKRTEGPTYECSPTKTGGGCGRARIVMRPLEEYIAEQVFTRLDSPDLREAMARESGGVDDKERELRKAVMDDEQRLVELANERDDNLIGEAEYRRRRARLTDRLEANRMTLERTTRKRARTNPPPGAELRAVWADKGSVWKRTILASIIERIDIGPHPVNPDTGRLFTSAPPRRKGEDHEAWRKRFDLHRARVFASRVYVTWLV
ncbi:recombinase family protein [Micromonospora haikouensis]|uniref:Site-specific DNA recombinase n=1 Tax=Micromonospora haikouensis TaxID=686309 RepID=A0A0D0X5H0_9ACTN|nr:recombinase family protein [Micromonospora haikouensis]KIR64745.1 hypothetical protein TK50_03760 [Micromonospora haikouensis]